MRPARELSPSAKLALSEKSVLLRRASFPDGIISAYLDIEGVLVYVEACVCVLRIIGKVIVPERVVC